VSLVWALQSECHWYGQIYFNRNGGENFNFTEMEKKVSLLMACHMNKKNKKGNFKND